MGGRDWNNILLVFLEIHPPMRGSAIKSAIESIEVLFLISSHHCAGSLIGPVTSHYRNGIIFLIILTILTLMLLLANLTNTK